MYESQGPIKYDLKGDGYMLNYNLDTSPGQSTTAHNPTTGVA